MRKRGGEVRKGGNNGESLPLRSLLDSRRMRREHTGRVSKDAYEAGQGEGKWFHHGCITILVGSCLKRCLELSTECSHLSNVIPHRAYVGTVQHILARKSRKSEQKSMKPTFYRRAAAICYTMPNRCQKMLHNILLPGCLQSAWGRETVPGYASQALPTWG